MPLAPLTLLVLAQSVLTVPVPLERYDELTRPKKEPRSLTVVESARLTGSFARGLTVTFSGRSLGELPTVQLLGQGGATLQGCTSDQALLARNASGGVELAPLGARFTVRCGVPVSDYDPVSLEVFGVVDVSGTVADGVVRVTSVRDGAATLEVSHGEAARALDQPELRATVVGRYRVTVMPDEVRFRWELDVHNPNRHALKFPLLARADETFDKLETSARYAASAEGFEIELLPGDVKLSVTGTMKGTRFTPPVDAAAQYVLLDNHPLLKVDVVTDAKLVSPTQTGLTAEFRGAQGLLLPKGQALQWKTTIIETLPSLSYAVQRLASTYYVGPDGTVFGESAITVENGGAAALTLPMRSKPEYASVGGTSLPLTSTKTGDLRLPLARGAQQIEVQHKGLLSTGFGFASGTLEVPGVGATATSSSIELRAGRDWVPLFESFSNQRWFALPPLGNLVLVLLFGAWAVHLFTSLGLKRRSSLALGSVTAVLASSTSAAHWPVLIGLAGGTMLYVVAWVRESRVKLVAPPGMVGLTVAMGLGMLLIVGATTLFGDNIRRLWGMSADALAGESSAQGSYAVAGTSSGAPQQYQGVGAKRDLPWGSRRVSLNDELVDATAPSSAHVVLVSSAVVSAAWRLLNLVAVAMAFALRRQLLAGVKAQLQRLFAARPAEQEPARQAV